MRAPQTASAPYLLGWHAPLTVAAARPHPAAYGPPPATPPRSPRETAGIAADGIHGIESKAVPKGAARGTVTSKWERLHVKPINSF